MTRRRRGWDWSGRTPLFSAGRPLMAGRAEQWRFWAAIAAGKASENAAVEAGIAQAVGTRLFRKAGTIHAAITHKWLPIAARFERWHQAAAVDPDAHKH